MITVFFAIAPVAILGLFGIAAKIDPKTGHWRARHRSTRRDPLQPWPGGVGNETTS